MREVIVPEIVQVAPEINTTDAVVRHATGANPVLFARRDAQGAWQDISAREFYDDVRALAKGLIASGIEPEARVAIMSRTRYEWTLLDYAIWFAGGISVPIYDTSSPAQVAWILQDSDSVAAFAETEEHLETIRQAISTEHLDTVAHLWSINESALDSLRAAGQGVSDEELEARRTRANLGDVATIIYTSGTTGRPKGCEITHGNFVQLTRNANEPLAEVLNNARSLMFLPLAHVLARYFSIMFVEAGAQMAHTPDVKNLLPDLQSFKPTFILCVPRVLEKVYNSSMLKAEAEGKGKIFNKGAQVAIDYSRAEQEGKVPLGLKLAHSVFDKLLYAKIRAAMGSQVSYAISGGAPLGERLGHFFHGIGLNVMEGYGLTETTAPVTVNMPRQTKIGTVGRPVGGSGIRIAEDGEVLAKGVGIFPSYHHLPDLTEEVFDDGWFRTGDLGQLDEDGFLRITGRKKEIIVTAGGKNVAPAGLEDSIRSDALVSQVIVLGEARPFISALVTLDEDTLPGWLERHGHGGKSLSEAIELPELHAEIQKVVDKANTQVSRAESIRAFRIVPTDFTEASGHMTPSLKIKRAKILDDYAALVEDIYGAPAPGAPVK